MCVCVYVCMCVCVYVCMCVCVCVYVCMCLVVLRLSGLLGQEKLRGSQSILSRGFFSPRFPRRSVSTFVGLCPVLNLRGHSHPSFHSAQPTQIPPFLFQLIREIVK